MKNLRDVDLSSLDYTALTPSQRDAVRWEALRRANAARDALLDESLRGIGRALRLLPGKVRRAVQRCWTNYNSRRRRRAEIALLRGLSDYELKDIRLSRFDIDALAHTRSGTMTREKEPAKIAA